MPGSALLFVVTSFSLEAVPVTKNKDNLLCTN